MAKLPIRNLGAVGVITDANPHDLPPNAFTEANNVIFYENSVHRAPVFKEVFSAIRSFVSIDDTPGDFDSAVNTFEAAEGGSSDAARFVGSYADPLAGETVFICDNDGNVRAYPNGQLSFATPGTTLVTNENPWTHAQVAGLSVLARKGMVPIVRNVKTDLAYSNMGNDWGVSDTAAVAREYLDFIILLNITKAGVEYPTMVKWCHPLAYSSPINTIRWDPSDTTSNAGENTLGELKTPLRDGMVLGSAFILYAQDQVWIMEYTGSSLVFNFRKLFQDGGVINSNCVVEVEGKHYVFGEDDIYVHDGNTKQSIADKRIRRKVYNTLDRTKQHFCSAVHDSVNGLIFFNYHTTLASEHFSGVTFTNKAAAYNYRSDTWSFLDLPNIVGGALINVKDIKPMLPVMLGVYEVSKGLTESRVYAVDLIEGGLVDLPVSTETLKPAALERTGLDLDDPGLGLSLRSYKTINSVVPQASMDDPSKAFSFTFGSSDLPTQAPVYTQTASFNPHTDYKMDMKVSGRYLAYKCVADTERGFKLSGFDADVTSLSRR